MRKKANGHRTPESIADLWPDEENARRHPDRNLEVIEQSIREVGLGRSIVIDERGRVLAGNGVVEGAHRAGKTKLKIVDADGDEVVAVRRSGLSEEQKTRLALYDNFAGEQAEWNDAQLAIFAADGLLEGIWSEEEIEDYLAPTEQKEGDGGDDFDPVPKSERCQIGDLWELGTHRLAVGDARSEQVVSTLLGDLTVDMILTDPPFGVDLADKAKTPALKQRKDGLAIENDAYDDEKSRLLVKELFTPVPLKRGGVFYLFAPPGGPELAFRLALVDLKLDVRQSLVWIKEQFVLGRQDYQWRHESILYGWKSGAGHHFVDDRTQSTVLEFDRPARSAEHPTMKPVALVERLVANSSRLRQIVYDPCLGSGTTLVACERLGRRCYGVEIDPHFASVVLDRYEAETGDFPTLVERNGKKRASTSRGKSK